MRIPTAPLRALLLASLGACAAILPAALARAAENVDAAEILRRAEEIRNPAFDHAIEMKTRTLSPEGKAPERIAEFTLLARARTGTVVVRRRPPILAGGVLMIAEGTHRMLMQRAPSSVELSDGQVVFGDIVGADLARFDLASGFSSELLGEERFEQDLCYKLQLIRAQGAGIYNRVLYWIAKKDFLPRRLELYGMENGRLVRMVRYEDFEKGPLGLRAMTMVVEGGNPWEDSTVVRFSNPRKVDASAVEFGVDGLTRFRDAIAGFKTKVNEAPPPIEEVLSALAKSRSAPAHAAPDPAPTPR